MATLHHNISGELTQELLAPGNNVKLSKISLTNVQKVSKCKVDLYINRVSGGDYGKFYLLKGVELPIGATLIYDDIKFNNAVYGLYIKLTDGETFTLTGSIDPTASTTVTGVSTLFLSEVSIGDEILVSSETRTVSAIASNTSLTVSVATTNTANDTTPDCNPTALVDVIIN
tara:strand:- start:550 stop:1065 length:516 start_codon:yes stop_codon:yes gene_type:complete